VIEIDKNHKECVLGWCVEASDSVTKWRIYCCQPPPSALLASARLCQRQFCIEERSLTIQDFEISGGASGVTQEGQTDGILQIRNGCLLADPDLVQFLVAD
jgi:hypothetical protein